MVTFIEGVHFSTNAHVWLLGAHMLNYDVHYIVDKYIYFPV